MSDPNPTREIENLPKQMPAQAESRVPREPSVYQKIAAVMAELEQLEAYYNERLRFSYIRDEDLVAALRPLMGRHGLVFELAPVEFEERTQTRDKDGQRVESTFLVFKAELRIIDVETGGSTTPTIWTVEAYDAGDKVREILYTKVKKAYLIATFLVGAELTEDDDRGHDGGKRNESSPRGDRRTNYPPNPLNDKLKALVKSGTSYDRLTEIAHEFGYKGDKIVKAPDEIKRQVLAKLGMEV